MKTLLLKRPSGPAPSSKHLAVSRQRPATGTEPASGAFVACPGVGGATVFGKVCGRQGDQIMVRLAVPDSAGVLMVTDCITPVAAATAKRLDGEPIHRDVIAKFGSTTAEFSTDCYKGMTIIKSDDIILDYRGIVLEGFASTFENVTPRDRDGDAISKTAFNDTIQDFMRNPVLLFDHQNSVKNLAGSFTKLSVTANGLAVQAKVSDSPDMRHIRFLIAEKHLKAFSIGGLFMFGGPDGRLIEKVILFEISLVAIPANPDALFSVRSVNAEDVATATKRFNSNSPATMGKLLGKFNPDQPRDEDGRWTDGDGETSSSGDESHPARPALLAGESSFRAMDDTNHAADLTAATISELTSAPEYRESMKALVTKSDRLKQRARTITSIPQKETRVVEHKAIAVEHAKIANNISDLRKDFLKKYPAQKGKGGDIRMDEASDAHKSASRGHTHSSERWAKVTR
jgi:HK97 family phage prohead protease